MLSHRIITPDELELAAVVPQCLDNAYVSPALFNTMVAEGLTFEDQRVASAKIRDTRTEYMRSLVYADQVIVNRIHVYNNPAVRCDFEQDRRDDPNRQAFISMLQQRSILPFLWKETKFGQTPHDTLAAGSERAVSRLLEDLTECPAVRLSKDDAENLVLAAGMQTRFHAYFSSLKAFTREQVQQMCCELFNPGPELPTELSLEQFEAFHSKLEDVSNFVFHQPRGEAVNREKLYKQFITSGPNTVQSRLRSDPFTFELKKLFDLMQSINTPDFLQRYAFTPVGLPARSALVQTDRAPTRGGTKLIGELLDNVRHTFVGHSQKAMTLPLLGDLTLADVHEIRTSIPEWRVFVDSQRAILREPERCLDLIGSFSEAFAAFQVALSAWYYEKYRRPASERRYATAISLGLKVGGVLMSAMCEHSVLRIGAEVLPDFIPERVSGLAAKLLVKVYDADRRKLDADRSYSVEILHDEREFTREDINLLVAKFRESAAESRVSGVDEMADSSKGCA